MTPEAQPGPTGPDAPVGHVVVVGAINVDLVVAADRLPGPGETVVGAGVDRHGGGKGANAAVAAARAGAAVRLIGAVGRDDTGTSTLAELRAQHVDVSGVALLEDSPTGVALIVVDPRGENQIAVGAGANASVAPAQIRAAMREALPAAGCVLVSTEIPGDAVVAAVEAATAAGIRCVLNPAPVVPAVLGLLSHSGVVLTPNATELAELATALDGDGQGQIDHGEMVPPHLRSTARGARQIANLTGAPVAVTVGPHGAIVVTPDGYVEHVPARPTAVRDTTGAGDTFNGVLAARFAAGDDLDRAIRTAIAAASLSVAEVGARAGMPTAEAIEDALQTA